MTPTPHPLSTGKSSHTPHGRTGREIVMMKTYLSHAGVDVYCGGALEVLKALPSSIAQTCVTSPPYFGLPPYYGIIEVWKQIKANSKKASVAVRQPSLNQVSTGAIRNHSERKNTSSKSTSKSSDLSETSPQSGASPSLQSASGSSVTKSRAAQLLKQEQLRSGGYQVPLTGCTAGQAVRTPTGKAAALQSVKRATHLSSGRTQLKQSGNAIKQRASVAEQRPQSDHRSTFITLFHSHTNPSARR